MENSPLTISLLLIQPTFAERCLVPVWDPGDWTRLPEQWVIGSWGDSDTPSKKAMKQVGERRGIKKNTFRVALFFFFSTHNVLTMRAKLHK